jgi:hypothetical protein
MTINQIRLYPDHAETIFDEEIAGTQYFRQVGNWEHG